MLKGKLNVNILVTGLAKSIENNANVIEALQKTNTVVIKEEYVGYLIQALNKLFAVLNDCKGDDEN